MPCPSGKKEYPTFWAANRENKKKVREHCIDMAVYKCKFCNQWHLSGHAYKKEKELRRLNKWK